MKERIVEIAENGRSLSRDRGFMRVAEGGEEIGRMVRLSLR